MSIVCIYHNHCQDGFAAAWAVHHLLGTDDDVEFIAASYGDKPPLLEVYRDDVVIVDFSYPKAQLDEIRGQARSLLVLDHHKTAQADLSTLPQAPARWDGDRRRLELVGFCPDQGGYATLFDMNRSGAGLAWDWFYTVQKGRNRPDIIDRVEDRDLWRFSFDDTKEICAALASYDHDFKVWDALLYWDLQTLASQGAALARNDTKRCKELIAAAGPRRIIIDGHDVPVVNCPFFMASEIGQMLSKGESFSATYFDTPRGRQYSLRSTPEGLDVSAIAKLYGGGGHQHAAGFTRPLDWWG